MDATQLREFMDKVTMYEKQVTPGPWKALSGQEGVRRSRAAYLGRMTKTRQALSFVTSDGSPTPETKRDINAEYMLYLRNNAPELVEAIEAGTAPAAQPTYYSNPILVKHMYDLLVAACAPGIGLEAILVILGKAEAYLGVQVGVTDGSPYQQGDVDSVKDTLINNILPTLQTNTADPAMTAAQIRTWIVAAQTDIRNELVNIQDPAITPLPDTYAPIRVHAADLIIRSVYEMFPDPLLTEVWHVDRDDQKTLLVGKLANAAALLEPMYGVKSCAPYVETEITQAKTVLNAIVSTASTLTWEQIQAQLDTLKPYFAKNYDPMAWDHVPWMGDSYGGRPRMGGTQFVTTTSK